MALNTKIRGNQINDAFFGKGLQRKSGDDDTMEILVDDSTVEISTDTVQVKDDGITNTKLANMTQGTIKVGGSSDAPTDLNAKADGYMLIGDGTDIASVALSGDITITNAGVTTIGSGKVDDDMLAGSISDGNLAEDYIKTSEVDDSTIEFDSGTLNVKALGIDTAQLALDAVDNTILDLAGTYDFNAGGGTVKVSNPTDAKEVANKEYVDALSAGIDPKESVRCAGTVSDGNITLSGTSGQSLDDVSLDVDDRVLLMNQTDDKENGIWVVSASGWARPDDFATDDTVAGAFTFVEEGTDYADNGFVCSTDAPNDVVGTNDLAFTQFSGTGQIVARYGLSKDGNNLDVNVDDSSIEISGDTLQVKAVGITNAMLAGSIADTKLTEDYIKTSEVDDSTIEFGASLNVKDDGITNAKLANITRGSVKVGGGSDAPTDLNAKTDGYILIGDGTDVNSVVTSGDAVIANDGVITIQATSVENSMLAGSIADTKLAEDYIKTSEVDDSSIEFDSNTLNVKALGITNAMLAGSIADGKLTEDYIKTSEVDDSTIEFGASLNVKALGITNAEIANDTIAEGKLDIHNAPTEGYILAYTSNGMEWITGTDDAVVEGDIAKENESANCNGVTTNFTLDSTPLANSLQVFLNGLLQEDGSGKDYTVSGTTVAFVEAPLTNDILIVHYMIDN